MSVLTITSLAFTGEHRGVSISYTQGSTLRCYRMERTAIGKEPIEEYLGHTGVYVLYNETDIYIGEATNVFNRLKSHNKTKEFWTDVLCFTTIDHSVDQGDAKYLEARLIKLANATGRYKVHNNKEETVHKSTEIKRLTRESLLQLILQFGEFFNVQINVPVDATVPVAEKSVVTITPTATVTETVAEPAPTPVQELKVTDHVLTSPHYTLYESARIAIDGMKPLPLDILREQLYQMTIPENAKVLVLNSMEHAFAITQLYTIPAENITYQSANPAFTRIANKAKFKLYNATHPLDLPDMEFDIVIGNPPYQDTTGAANAKSIWHKFVASSFQVCKDNGYVALVHPGTWRLGKPLFKETKELLTNNKLKYLNMNSAAQGQKVFGAGTSFDYYVCQKAPAFGKTKLVGTDNSQASLDLSGVSFIPAASFDFYENIIAGTGDVKVDVLKDSTYHTQREHVQEEQTSEFCYPVVYSITREGVNYRYTNDNSKGHFGVPKVIFSNGSGGNLIVDADGSYGMSEFCFAIADQDPENLQAIYDFFMDSANREVLKGTKAAINMIEPGFLKSLKQDFWK